MRLRERRSLDVWTRFVGEADDRAVTDVVVVPPDGDPLAAREVVATVRARGGVVRVVGRGVTSPRFVASWGTGADARLTEFDAFLPSDKRPAQRRLEEGLRRWLDDVVGDCIDGVAGHDAFWASAVTRMGLQDVFDTWCFVDVLAGHHGTARFHVTAPWIGTSILTERLRESGHGAVIESFPVSAGIRIRRRVRRAVLGVASLAAVPVAVGTRLREFWAETRTRRHLDTLRAAETPRAEETVWLGVNGPWEYSSRHVIQPLGKGAQEASRAVGVLLQSTLKPGNFGGAHRGGRSDELLPALHSAALDGVVDRVEQVVSHASWGALLRSLPATTLAMGRAATRAIRHDSIDFGPFRVSIEARLDGLPRLVSLDVLRGRESAAATRRFVSTHDVRGARFALSQASLVVDAVPDLILQTAGAETLEVIHGALFEPLDMISTARAFSTKKLLWTRAEADYLKDHVSSTCIGGHPSRIWEPRERRAPDGRRHVLVLSNYATFGGGGHRKRLPRIGYQDHLLADVVHTTRARPGIVVRWRPHPGDEPTEVARAVAEWKDGLELSRGNSLEDDLAWADVIVGSLSSTLVEALAWDKPLLLHDVPIHEAEVLMCLFSPQRRFRDALEFEDAFAIALGDLEAGGALEPETELRRLFFGPSGVPKPLADVVYGR
ncbi:MAG: hypothetical protein U0169_16220 [Polyangiaceae bacterium]